VTGEVEPQVARTADRLRDEFLITLRELGRRGHRAMDVRALLRDNRRVVIAAVAGLTAMVIVILGVSVALSRPRHVRLSERRIEGLRRAWDNPDRLATRAEGVPRPLSILLGLLKVTLVAAGSQLIRRTVHRARPAGV